jgi:hypothetical protein
MIADLSPASKLSSRPDERPLRQRLTSARACAPL